MFFGNIIIMFDYRVFDHHISELVKQTDWVICYTIIFNADLIHDEVHRIYGDAVGDDIYLSVINKNLNEAANKNEKYKKILVDKMSSEFDIDMNVADQYFERFADTAETISKIMLMQGYECGKRGCGDSEPNTCLRKTLEKCGKDSIKISKKYDLDNLAQENIKYTMWMEKMNCSSRFEDKYQEILKHMCRAPAA